MILSKIFNNKNKNGWCASWKVIATLDGGSLGHTVTFYDMTQSNFPNGQTVATYYLNTIVEHGYDLFLDLDVDYWSIVLKDLEEIQDWLDAVDIYFKCLKENLAKEEMIRSFKLCFRNINKLELYFSAQGVLLEDKTIDDIVKNIDRKKYQYLHLYDCEYLLEIDLTFDVPKIGVLYDVVDAISRANSLGDKVKTVIVESLGYRRCSKCNKFFKAGFVVDDGSEYYCSEECLHQIYSDKEYQQMYNDDIAYYTEWNFEKLL